MPRKKKLEETLVESTDNEVTEPTPEATPEAQIEPVVESEAKRSFRDLLAKYKAQSPDKYIAKEKELLAKLDQIP